MASMTASTSRLAKDPRTRQVAAASALGAVVLALLLRTRKGKSLVPKTPAPLATPQLEAQLRDLYQPQPDGSRILLVPTAGRVAKVVIRPTKASTLEEHSRAFAQAGPVIDSNVPPTPGSKKRPLQVVQGKAGDPAPARRVGVNKEFFRQLRAIFAIIIPRSTAKEVFLLTTHTFFLLMRTYLSLLVAKLDGIIVRDLVSANARGFIMGLVYWYLLAIPSTYTNSMIRFLQQKLAISFRTRLTRYVHDLYLSKARNYYKVINLDSRIEGADQFITTDVARFCDTLSSLYSNVSKPSLDLLLFNYQLGRSIGPSGSLGLFVSYVATAYILRAVTPAFGKLAAVEAKLEGEFRGAHSRLITNAEEIAFYNGAALEKNILSRIYLRLMRHINSIYKIRIAYTMIEDFVIKYMWSATGYCLISIPVFFGDKIKAVAGQPVAPASSAKVAQRTENYISNRRLLLSLADAGGRLMYSYKELAELAGHTSRVYALLSTLHALNKDQYQSVKRPAELAMDAPFYDLGHINGVLVNERSQDAGIEFDRVPIVAPAPGLARGGEELAKELMLSVQPGEHLLVTGPNGVGKTGIARVLAGLWPAFEGVVRRPESIIFLPQRPYLSLGSLRDQVIYPHTYAEFKASGGKDVVLHGILEKVHLAYLPDREGGFDTRKEWKDVLSGGEKQRMGMARLFYHKPRYGVLDECTSAVSTDVEGLMYNHAKELGITLMTISHRPSLLKYHGHLLRLTGEHGEWELTKVGTAEEQVTFDKELATLEAKLKDVDAWKARLEAINKELAFQST